MNKALASVFIISSSLVQPSYAQFTRQRTVGSPGRIIAGIIVAVLIAFFLLCFCIMMRRRRTGRLMAVGPSGGGFMQPGPKPLFGGPWGRSNAGYNGQNTPMGPYPNQGSNYYHQNGAQPQWQAPYDSEYPGPNDPAPPPSYGQDAEYGRQFNPPPGPPPQQSSNQSPYAPPLGPPPAAHTTGKDNQFYGGF
ncbi:hypothetical protein BJ912DRAFT_1040658 [Pholiota molesta]|nr:hypothetical protein BJ912DRAFT_1040658 [Pholiota molesta]